MLFSSLCFSRDFMFYWFHTPFKKVLYGLIYLYVLSMFYRCAFLLQRKEPILSDMCFLCFVLSYFLFLSFFNRPLVSSRLSSIKNVLMITWKYSMEKPKNHQFLEDCVATRYQSPLWPLGIKCLFGLFLMHLFKGKAFRPPILQVSKLRSCFSFLRARFLFRWMQCIL